MAKSQKNKNVQVFLSPENYVRKKSRSLPIVKCIINTDWDKRGLANVVIARKHTNGNFTFCMYLVDTKCIGVKDTFFKFNVPQSEFDNIIRDMKKYYEVEEVSYELAHNIIFAAIEFAEEYGFSPHKDFSSTTQYFLEEDDDNIPLIEIHCGNKDGVPLYINAGYESSAEAKKIINQLEKTAGKGNFEYIVNKSSFDFDSINDDYEYDEDDDDEYEDDDDEYEDDDDEYDEDDDEYEDDEDDDEYDEGYEAYLEEILKMNKEDAEQEASDIFKEYQEKVSRGLDLFSDPDFIVQLDVFVDFWRHEDNMVDMDLVDKYTEMVRLDFSLLRITVNDEVPNSLFPSFTSKGKILEEDLASAIFAINVPDSAVHQAERQVKVFKRQHGDCAALSYLNLILDDRRKKQTYSDIIKELERYPNYFLIEVLKKEKELQDLPKEQIREQLMKLVEGKTITELEATQFILTYAILLFDLMNDEAEYKLEKCQALVESFECIRFPDIALGILAYKIDKKLRDLTINEFFKRREFV
ncbi:MAG: hypothetical protein LBC98_08435 [Prevotellaceae bacterium]|jgi:hypothetical protein|nr:hypothetical protein [Prevotellaceae bacterium]